MQILPSIRLLTVAFLLEAFSVNPAHAEFTPPSIANRLWIMDADPWNLPDSHSQP